MADDTLLEKTAFYDKEYPFDLILVVVWLAASIVAFSLTQMIATPLLSVLALPLVLFIPGYCLLAALFPKKGEIGLAERIALSFGLSIAVMSLIGLGLIFTPVGVRPEPLVISMTVFSLVMVLLAFFQRAVLRPNDRFSMPFSEIGSSLRTAIFPHGDTRVDHLLSIVLILVIIVALTTTIYVIASPKEREQFSEFYLLGEDQMAADYPDQILVGLNYPIFIGVGNHEYKNMAYTVETWAALTEYDNQTNSTAILVMDPLDQMSLTLAHNETQVIPYNLSARKAGYNRVEFLLFNETVPGPEVTGSDRINASYRDLYLRVNIPEAGSPEPSD